LEEKGCVCTLGGIVTILLVYNDDIVLLARSYFDLDKKIRIINGFSYNYFGM
jgi:hypothetical protein